ncbi:PDZ domain-containing protein [Polyangium jinanense]|uniref:PDZ domain-containing protein n=1 Tax=Polyangium jinanense TaxID=2829994 RepID=A0A9X4ANN0_9BACT|nr:PDZ domain-containing protein [Polyangium jinanense]MDC3953821.1 PDZ domain-containing protein [Polyangium jinanense]MDC3979058.1 PDZ domain-containing protein [Polyangium jinanense]
MRVARASLLASFLFVGLACAAEQKGSIGAVLSRDNDTGALYVRDLSPGLAAERAGLLPGDELLMIEGRYVRDLDAKEIRALLRGDVGTSVRLTIVRGEEVRRVRVERRALLDPKKEERPRTETITE